ncbi:hypothetical protein COS81_02320 [candidate division WWE3 bacterium CG06_land_8_20_14_3_00_42_16]|uniref:Cysteine-rich domain-containing protein n=3 Tax=Katanobacteria TaxID=422282 RepID=A0A2M7ANA6_UNCKA|nr:MAG: hypothetical protein COS81_02320 [candidate division WWE3 bacterium CG06_land_8_20_14_3_00_42_16]PIZ41754.1 MAG: hypothetical protein COY34_03935 [candidate division WWE3 bacterium CG_4_10_14_0_2_um_filter_42_8]PJC67966.1 MAG: hypothetical protein CO015_05740 [candidate division WWE3 bacterium CG_4_8_14_3_um_filter_42_11]
MAFWKKLVNNLSSGNTLYYPGCLTKFGAPQIGENYRKLLQLVGIDFIELAASEVCCGSPVLNAGGKEEFRSLAQKNLDAFQEHGISQIITSCPACYKVLSQDYPAVLGEMWKIEVKHLVQVLAQRKEKLQEKVVKNERFLKITYHDPCHLGRHSGLYHQPREVLQSLGFEVREMALNQQYAFCCGGGGGLASNNPDLSQKIALERLKQAEKTEAEVLVTPCTMCYLHFKKNAKGIKVMEFGELVMMRVNRET